MEEIYLFISSTGFTVNGFGGSIFIEDQKLLEALYCRTGAGGMTYDNAADYSHIEFTAYPNL